MRFFLTGFMGSGKTFWAKKLSRNLQIPYIDLDEYIEEKEKISIEEIFELNGETYFRQLENYCLKEIVSTYSNIIVSCGGGTPCFYDNKKIMKAVGKIIFFEVDINTLTVRLIRKKIQRPALKNIKDDEIKEFIIHLLDERKNCYQDYDLKIEADLINETTFVNLLKNYV